jgi:uncharacterized membrane-anchored protein YhcB (DUF1043 family)
MEQGDSGNTVIGIIILLILFTPLLFAWLSKQKRKKIEAELESSKAQLNASQKQVVELNDKYSSIIDMELHTQRKR